MMLTRLKSSWRPIVLQREIFEEKDDLKRMEAKRLLSLPEGFEVTTIEVTDGILTIGVVSTQISACCPLCSSAATRLHSSYTRTVADLPCAGQQVRLRLHVRRFFCTVTTCARKIFVERIASFIEPWARVTLRLHQSVQMIGFATGGMLGARVTQRLGIQTCWMTIIRRMMALPTEPVEHVVELGIDDFAFRRGRKFGSILVDMQSHKVIDLLPDRTKETAAAWISAHPEIDLVSRDRGGDYAAGARVGAPQATQIADRFHLYKNLVEAVELTLARCRAEIRKTASQSISQEERSEPLVIDTEFVSVENWKPAPDACSERERLNRRAERLDKYEQSVALGEQGLGCTEIARRIGLSVRTIQRWLKEEIFPEARRRRKRHSGFDPYAAYVLKRWEQGCQNGSQLYREIKEQGYTGQERQVHRFLVPLRKKQRIMVKAQVPHAPLQDFSAKDAVWLFARDEADLDEKQRQTLAAICQASETASKTYELVQQFRHMLHYREGEKLDDWLAKVKKSQIRELQSFVIGVERDKAAVVAGLTLLQNNGLVEGKVNKLKLIKRMMYGRAKFPLLRQRVLHAL
jgi:transposase